MPTSFALLAQAGPLEGLPVNPIVVVVVVAALVLISLVMFFVTRYRRCPSNRVLVVYGKVGAGKAARVYNGGGAFIWPVIQEYEFLDLTPHQIEIALTDALSLENIRVKVPSVVTVAIGDTEAYHQNAAQRLLNLNRRAIEELAQNIIFGQMRQVIASMAIEEINRDREGFTANIVDSLEPELMKIGLKLINVNIVDISDESDYIKSIGEKAAAKAVQNARGDVAEEEKQGEIRVAQANQEKDIAVADAGRAREIGVQEAERDKAVRIADLNREKEVAQERAQFQRDTEVARADQERRVAVAEADATAVQGETQSRAKVAAAEAELAVREAEAFEKGESRRRVAQAAVEEAENRAQAQAALADAERIEAEKRAELEAPAKAEKARRIVDAEASAESQRLVAQGEADAAFAMLEAEARGEFEKLSKKAEGLREIVEACGGAEEAYQLLMLEHLDHLADKAAEAIQNIKFDKVTVWGGSGSNGASAGVSSFVEDLMGSLPPALHTMLDIGGIRIADGLVEVVDDDATAQEEEGERPSPGTSVVAGRRDAPRAPGGAAGSTASVGRDDPSGKGDSDGAADGAPPAGESRGPGDEPA